MEQRELLVYAMSVSAKLVKILEQAYAKHDHEHDLRGGILLSSIVLLAKGLNEGITAILISQKSSE